MKQYEMFEIALKGKEPEGSWAEPEVWGTFICGDEEKRIKGFYAGGGVYKVRYLPQSAGHCRWKVTGVVEAEGREECVSSFTPPEMAVKAGYQGDETGVDVKSVAHGLVRAEGLHFKYEDGTHFTPIGTTVYALAHQEEQLIEQTFKTLSGSPFNKVRHCVFPKHFDYNSNEPKYYAFEKDEEGNWDVHRPCMAFWEHLESVIRRLEAMGIQSDVILFHPYDRWGFSKFTMEQNLIYLDYAIRRLSAFPSVWWSMANEYDMVFSRGTEDWYELENFIAQNDPYHHMLSNHQCVVIYDYSRENITHCSLQIRDADRVKEFMDKYKKPVIYDECAYEGNLPFDWGNISGFELTNRFWCIYAQGAYATHGEVFLSEDDVLWWAKGGILKGESPARIAFLKKILDEAGGPLERWNLREHAAPGEFRNLLDHLKKMRKDNPLVNLYLYGEGPEKDGLFCTQEYAGHCGREFYLQYLARSCPGILTMYLPNEGHMR